MCPPDWSDTLRDRQDGLINGFAGNNELVKGAPPVSALAEVPVEDVRRDVEASTEAAGVKIDKVDPADQRTTLPPPGGPPNATSRDEMPQGDPELAAREAEQQQAREQQAREAEQQQAREQQAREAEQQQGAQ